MRHFKLKRQSSVKTKKPYIKFFLWTLLSISILLKIFFTISSLEVSSTISNLEKESQEIAVENRRLQRELVAKTSLRDLEVKAPELGFVNQVLPINIKVDEVFAQVLR